MSSEKRGYRVEFEETDRTEMEQENGNPSSIAGECILRNALL